MKPHCFWAGGGSRCAGDLALSGEELGPCCSLAPSSGQVLVASTPHGKAASLADSGSPRGESELKTVSSLPCGVSFSS